MPNPDTKKISVQSLYMPSNLINVRYSLGHLQLNHVSQANICKIRISRCRIEKNVTGSAKTTYWHTLMELNNSHLSFVLQSQIIINCEQTAKFSKPHNNEIQNAAEQYTSYNYFSS